MKMGNGVWGSLATAETAMNLDGDTPAYHGGLSYFKAAGGSFSMRQVDKDWPTFKVIEDEAASYDTSVVSGVPARKAPVPVPGGTWLFFGGPGPKYYP